MLVVFGVALLVLAAAVVVLFAMLAELAARVPEQAGRVRSQEVYPLDGARVGHSPDVWPMGTPEQERSVILVLSTICNSCEDVAQQLVSEPGHTDWAEMSLLVSTGAAVRGDDFVARHRLQQFPHFIDEGGEWVSGQFGVQSSPAALAFEDGRLVAAYEFNDVAALRVKLADVLSANQEEIREKEEV
jgi:hypothetical protein